MAVPVVVASWAPAARRVSEFLAGGSRVSTLRADIAVIRGEHCLWQHPDWRRDILRAEQMLRAEEAAAARAKRARHERNASARAEENRQFAKAGGAGSKKH